MSARHSSSDRDVRVPTTVPATGIEWAGVTKDD
jgi:hypothetical protein